MAPRESSLLNPLLDAFTQAMATQDHTDDPRTDLIARYGFAVPSNEALNRIAHCSPAGVIEIGAGTGYWAHALHARGVNVEAFDIEPPPSPHSQWFAHTQPWHPVHRRDDRQR